MSRLACSVVLLLAAAAFAAADGDIWAVLVAGSNGWYNYRHQADVAHSYQILTKHGVSPDHIITFMYDDIANNPSNKYKGKLFNNPKGKDVYAGVKIDYKGSACNQANFAQVLRGNSSGVVGGNGRVLKSNKNDRVFVFFSDHGAPGLIAFPEDIMTVQTLNSALTYAASAGLFKELVFYLESCESGSMFKDVLPTNIGVYAMTASNERLDSWAAYCDNPLNLPCLGDVFSVSWMENSDIVDLKKTTIAKQFTVVQKETDTSPVSHYGQLPIESEALANFQGPNAPSMAAAEQMTEEERASRHAELLQSAWPSRDVELLHHARLASSAATPEEALRAQQRVAEINEDRRAVRSRYEELATALFGDDHTKKNALFMEHGSISDVACHHEVVHAFDNVCVDLNKHEYALRYVNVLNNACAALKGDSAQIIRAMLSVCPSLF